jgi:hypothetical protein
VGAARAGVVPMGMAENIVSNANTNAISRLKVFILHLSFLVEII